MLLLLNWELLDDTRADTLDHFGAMTEEDDAEDHGPDVKVLGRWSDLGYGRGWCVAESSDVKAVYRWVANWSKSNCRCTVEVVVNDDMARHILRRKFGSTDTFWSSQYYNPGYAPEPDESLYLVSFAFNRDKVEDGFRAFASLTQAQDTADAGDCKPLGRWHNLGKGTGVVIAAAKNSDDMQKWAANWSTICSCNIIPVLNDKDARAVLSETD